MGSELLGEDSSSQESTGVGETEKQPTPSYTDLFFQCLPQYMAIGMSADEFWNCDPRMYKAYREMDRIKNERNNELLWIAGAYVYQAILLTAPRLNSLKPTEPDPYPDKPFDLGLAVESEEDEEEHEMTDEEIQKTPQFAKVLEWAMRVNKQKEQQNG